jgi:hypothetical protein
MPNREEEDVARAMRAVRGAYNDLQALQTSRHSSIPSSLSNADKTLDKLYGRISRLTNSPEALATFRGYVPQEANKSVETSLSGAMMNDMEAIATYFKAMKPEGPVQTTGELDEQKCQSIKTIIDRYMTIVSAVLSEHNECVQGISTRCMYPADP